MGKVIKYILIILATLIILAAIGIGILVYTFNPNELKAPITQQVKEMTGRNIVIEGNIGWKIFPWLGVSIHQVRLSNAPGFNQAIPFFKLKEADVSLRVLPLLTGNIEFGKITLDGLSLNLNTNKQGVSNWADLLKNQKAKQAEKTVPAPTAQRSKEKSASKFNLKPMDLSISSIDISNANISYDNQQKGQKYQLRNFNLNSQNISFNSAFPITMDFSFNSTQPNIYGQVSLNTKIAINQSKQTVVISPFVIDAQLNGSQFPKNGLTINLQSSVALNQKKATLDLSKLEGRIANLQFSGKINGIDIFKKPTFNGDFTIAKFNPTLFLKDLSLPAPKFEDPNAFTSTSLSSTFIVTPEAVSISKLTLGLDDSTLTGNAYLAMSNKGLSQFNIHINKIDAANYLPMASNKPTTPVKSEAKAKPQPISSQPLIPVKELRKLNLEGKLAIDQLTFKKLKASNLKLNISANDGIIKMANNSADIYKGKWLSNMALNVQTDTPVMQINEAINNVQIAPLTQALYTNKKLQITGTANLKASITTKGNRSTDLTKNLNGTGQFSLKNGIVQGINIGYQLDRALALVNKQAAPSQPANDETPFGSLTGSIQIQNGVIHNNDLLLTSKAMKVTGKGYANLVSQQLNYALDASANQSGVAPQIYELQQKIGGSIPLKMSGTFENFIVGPDIEAILKNLATTYLKKSLGNIKNNEAVNKGIKNLGNQLQKGLKGLFN